MKNVFLSTLKCILKSKCVYLLFSAACIRFRVVTHTRRGGSCMSHAANSDSLTPRLP